jgi:hypothetical protein
MKGAAARQPVATPWTITAALINASAHLRLSDTEVTGAAAHVVIAPTTLPIG